jgi:hypothetical protein
MKTAETPTWPTSRRTCCSLAGGGVEATCPEPKTTAMGAVRIKPDYVRRAATSQRRGPERPEPPRRNARRLTLTPRLRSLRARCQGCVIALYRNRVLLSHKPRPQPTAVTAAGRRSGRFSEDRRAGAPLAPYWPGKRRDRAAHRFESYGRGRLGPGCARATARNTTDKRFTIPRRSVRNPANRMPT